MKEKKPFVICDIDNVINNLCECFIQRYNYDFHTDYTAEDINEYNITKCIPISEDSLGFLYFHNPMFWKRVTTLCLDVDSSVFIKNLDEISDLEFATASTYDMIVHKIEFMNKHFPMINENRIMCVCEKEILNCDILIDDCYTNFKGNNYKLGIIISQPWNRNINLNGTNIQRVETFAEVLKLVHQFKGVIQ